MIFSGLVILVGLLLCAEGMRRSRRVNAASGWPTVKGRIIESHVTRFEVHADPRHSRKVPRALPSIVYRYEIGGTVYSGSRVAHANQTVEPSEAELIAAKYPEGREVDVYYDPRDVSCAVLEPNEDGEVPLAWFFFGLFTIMFGVVAALVATHMPQ